jgi:hypothetical protein
VPPPWQRAGPQRRQFALKARGVSVRDQGLCKQPITACTLLGRPLFGLRQQGSKVGDASFKRRYRSGVGRPLVRQFARRFIVLSVHVERNAGLATFARPSARPDRALVNGFGARSKRRSGLSRGGPDCLATFRRKNREPVPFD